MKHKISAAFRPARSIALEPLEQRLLFHGLTQIESFAADNRGQMVITFNHPLDASTVNSTNVSLFLTGPDDELGTGDDVKQSAFLNYVSVSRTLVVRAVLPANTPYRVRLEDGIRSSDNEEIDGEFNGRGRSSGNGIPGGEWDVIVRPAAQTIARFTTQAGIMDVRLFTEQTPQTVLNFLSYANNAAWDGTVIHRSLPGFVWQGGGFRVDTNTNQIAQIAQNAPVINEPGISNTRGRIAMAKLPNNANSATNQWFFNLVNNTGLDTQNGGFTAFGEVTNDAGLAVMDLITTFETRTVNNYFSGSTFEDVPIKDIDAVLARGFFSPTDDSVFVHRVAILMDVFASDTTPVIGIFRNGQFIFDTNGSGAFESTDRRFSFGLPSDTPVIADWNGDGVSDVGVFRNGRWILDVNGNGVFDAGDANFIFGITGDLPVVGDWDGDGDADVGIFRNGRWVLDANGSRTFNAGDANFIFGLSTDKPVVGDWNGDGFDDVGVYRNGRWILDATGNRAFNAGDLNFVYGAAGDQPVIGDWNNDGMSDIGIFRNGRWILDSNGDETFSLADDRFNFGTAGDTGLIMLVSL